MNRVYIHAKNCEYERYPRMRGRIRVAGSGKLEFGKNVRINSGKQYNPIGGDIQTIFYPKKNSIIKVGNGVGISNSAIVAMELIEIGDGTIIGGGCKIYDTDFHSLDWRSRLNENTDIPICAPVIIGRNVFIGGHSIVLKGVKIGDSSIIGAGSVVTKSIPSYQLWAGNPARFIKQLDK